MCKRAVCLLVTLTVTVAAQAPLEFEVASIKPNTANRVVPGPETNPGIGHYWLSYATAAGMIIQAYPPQGVQDLENVPAWARSEHYDVLAKGKPGATAAEQQQMWRALLASRLKLQVHYESRPRRGYRLVFARADQSLGPQIRPSTIDCTKQQPPLDANNIEATAMQRCRWQYTSVTSGGRTQVTGGVPVADIARVLAAIIGAPVIDATGLRGDYAVKLTWAPPPADAAAPPAAPGEAPSVFTAVREQLGLKLEEATVDVPTLVIDHIERPTDN